MTLSLLSDLHGHVPSPAAQAVVDKADAVCICGDIQSRAMHTFAWINATRKPVVLVPGNHEDRECGHIHTGDHTPVRLGSTLCRNVSYLDEQYTPAYLPVLIEI